MIFRLKILIPLVIFLALVFIGVYFLSDKTMKSGFEAVVPGLEFEEFDVKWGTSEVGLSSKGILIDPETNDKLLSWDEASMKLDPYPLGFKKVDIKEANIGGIFLSSKLFKKVADLAKGEDDEASASGNQQDGESKSGLPDMNFKDLDHEEILERITGTRNLESEAKLKKLDEDAKSIKEKWEGVDKKTKAQADEIKVKIDQFKNKVAQGGIKTDFQTEINQIKTKADALSGKKFEFKNVGEIPQMLNDVKSLKQDVSNVKSLINKAKSDLKSDLDFVKNTKSEIQQLPEKFNDAKKDIESIKKGVQGVRDAGKKDMELIKEEINPKNFDAAKITRLLFGKAWEEEFLYYQSLWFKIAEYLPEDDPEAEAAAKAEKEAQERLYASEKPIEYVRDPDFPQWTVRQFKVAGRTPDQSTGGEIDFKGMIYDMTSDETLHGKPISWDITAKSGQVHLTGLYSRIHKNKNHRYLKLDYKGQSMAGKKWGGKDMRIIFKDGELSTSAVFDLSGGDEVVGRGTLVIDQAVFSIGDEVKPFLKQPLKEAVEKLVAEPLPYKVTLRYKKMPKIEFGGKFDDVFKDALKAALKGKAQEESLKLSQKFQSKLEQKLTGKAHSAGMEKLLAGLSKNAGGLSQQLMGSLIGVENKQNDQQAQLNSGENALGSLTSQLLGIEGEGKNTQQHIQEQIKNRVEAEAKKRLEEEARKRLLGQQAEAQKQEALKKQLEEKKKQEANKLKDKLKDKIKLPF